jgi:uncharacterized protein (DUF1810 family)
MNNDRFDLHRFVDAQNPIFDSVRSELQRGLKTGHWMWFIFPQIQGLGHSPLARKYAISSLEEAKAYLQHPVLGARLIECTNLAMQTSRGTLSQIFGYPDDLKFRSCMTLFARASGKDSVFQHALEHFSAEDDPMTLERLGPETNPH